MIAPNDSSEDIERDAQAKRDVGRAERLRKMLLDFVEVSAKELPNEFGMLVRPFLPLLRPKIEGLSDETVLGILSHIKERVRFVEEG